MPIQEFFVTEPVKRTLSEASARLLAEENDPPVRHLGAMLERMVTSASEFDENCQISISTLGSRLRNDVAGLRKPFSSENVDFISSIVFRCLTEFDMSVSGELAMEIRSFMDDLLARMDSLPSSARKQIEHAQRGLSVALIKNLLNTQPILNLRNIQSVGASINEKITSWESKLDEQQSRSERLGELFEKHARDFNFSGLHEGFSDLATGIQKELRAAQVGIGIFGLLVLSPGILDLLLAFVFHQDFATMHVYTLVVAGIGTLTLTLLFLYFFRIALRKADSCRAQLVQVRLRMSLCRFIQPYTDYSKDVRKDSPETFSKFEALIFSGIVGTTEGLPSTFDGLEHIGAFAKSLRGKD
jgi:hypothetical protein